MFFPGSRYEKTDNYRFRRIDGSEVLLKKPRRARASEGRITHTVAEGDRTDELAHRYYGDPLLFWKLADGNPEMNPERLVGTAGRKIVVPPNDPD
jgi:hypothetical protein